MCIKIIASQRWDVFETQCSLLAAAAPDFVMVVVVVVVVVVVLIEQGLTSD